MDKKTVEEIKANNPLGCYALIFIWMIIFFAVSWTNSYREYKQTFKDGSVMDWLLEYPENYKQNKNE